MKIEDPRLSSSYEVRKGVDEVIILKDGEPYAKASPNLEDVRNIEGVPLNRAGPAFKLVLSKIKEANLQPRHQETFDFGENLQRDLSKTLGITEDTDKPVAFKHDGLKKKSQDGAHRFDKPVDFVQLKHDDQFGTKSDHKSLS